ncbi:MAG: hypothetical protein H7Z72_04610 [Bacteroidetes bacterium]|nr:hypothetical protein [Fibrella sp.]
MKLGQFLLAMYVLILSGLPCEAFCRDEPVIVTGQAALPTPGEHSDEEMCLICCLCPACPGFALPQSPRLVKVVTPTTPLIVAVLPPYQTPHTLDVPGRIWQPPRLG